MDMVMSNITFSLRIIRSSESNRSDNWNESYGIIVNIEYLFISISNSHSISHLVCGTLMSNRLTAHNFHQHHHLLCFFFYYNIYFVLHFSNMQSKGSLIRCAWYSFIYIKFRSSIYYVIRFSTLMHFKCHSVRCVE